MRSLFAVAVLLAGGCTEYIGAGRAPRIAAPQTVALRIDVRGNLHDTLEDALRWILRDNRRLRRVSDGGDGSIIIDAQLDRQVAILAGTDLVLRVRVRGDGLDATQDFKRTG